VLILSKDDLIGLLPPLKIVSAVEAALRAQAEGHAVTPKRLHLDWQGNTWLTMPSASEKSCGVKVVSVVPANATRGLPVTNGVMLLNDSETGIPLSLMNAAALTAQRTGAVGALGVKYQTPEDTASVGIVGCGVQGTWQAICACAVRPIKEVFAFNRSPDAFKAFAANVSQHAPGVKLTYCEDVRELLKRTNLVIAATTSKEPVLPDDPSLLENKHFISVGSFKPTMQELPDSVYRLAGLLPVDSEQARHEVGDVINALQRGLLKDENVFSIADCVTAKRQFDVRRTTAYKTVGAAMYDLFVAQAYYQEAKARGLGSEITL
jgi:ornithine cyclodeaminase/alanine dehydrogenase-like protein (mu-crystallin family)